MQTVLPALFRKQPQLTYRIETLETPDNDFVRLGWAGSEASDAPIAVLVHGLGGSMQSKYLSGLGLQLIDSGWRVCALELRGAGPIPNRLPRAYHHGDTADLRLVWRLLRVRHPESFLASVGWSLGGNVTLKALGEGTPSLEAPDFACAACVPFDLKACALHIRQGFARVYQAYLMKALKQMLQRKHTATPILSPANLEAALAASDFLEFDDAYTAPSNGFEDAEDYYARSSCGQFLKSIPVPTKIIQASDDPFMPPSLLPEEKELSDQVRLELADRGGHVGFIGGSGITPEAWLELRIFELLEVARNNVDSSASNRVAQNLPTANLQTS